MRTEISFITEGKDIDAIFEKMKKDAEDIGITVTGTSAKGTFSGFATKGEYEFTNKKFTAYIEKKPDYVHDTLIRRNLEEYFK